MPTAVLVVEDELPLVRVLQIALTDAGYHVSLSLNGADGLRQALTHHPDIILLDLMMPGMDGAALLHELRQDPWGVHARVVVLSNFSDSEHVFKAVNAGVLGYMVKADVSLEYILAQVRIQLERPEQQ